MFLIDFLLFQIAKQTPKRLAELYIDGLDEHLTTKVAIEMIGVDGVEWKEVSKKDIKRNKEFDIMVVTAGQEETMQTTEKRNKLTFLSAKSNDQTGTYNKKVMAQMEAKIAGFTEDEIKYMLDPEREGLSKLMAECAEDIQSMLNGKIIEVNDLANTAYMQKIKDYMRDESKYMLEHPKIANIFIDYMNRLSPVVMRNMAQQANEKLSKEGLPTIPGKNAGYNGIPKTDEDNGSNDGTLNSVAQMSLANYGK